jgi:predicted peptidase
LPATAGQEVLVTDNIPGEGIDGYWLYLPKNHNQQEKWPLIIYLHGASRVVGQLVDTKHLGPIGYASGQREPAEKNSKLMRKKFVIVSPHLAKDIFWWSQWKDQTETIDAIVDSLIANYAVDPDRIYVTGISRGGYGTWAYASRTKHQLAAIVPICGGSRGVEQWSKLDNLAIWAVHNEHDPVVPYYQSENAVKKIQDLCGKKFKPLKNAAPGKEEKYLSEQRLFTTFDRDGHDAWTDTYSHPHVYRWLLKQRAGD